MTWIVTFLFELFKLSMSNWDKTTNLTEGKVKFSTVNLMML